MIAADPFSHDIDQGPITVHSTVDCTGALKMKQQEKTCEKGLEYDGAEIVQQLHVTFLVL